MVGEVDRQHPHGGENVLAAGAPLDEAAGVIIALHGRGADAADIVSLAAEVAPPGVTILAPQAAGHTWYPYRFIEPFARNEPYLSSALRRVGELIAEVEERGIPAERIALLGFSQGACLTSEFAVRNAARYGGIVVYTGGLIGPPGTTWNHEGSFEGTPAFLGCSDVDAHIPEKRVDETADALTRMGAAVTKRIYPGMAHTVNDDEIRFAQELLAGIAALP